MRLVLGTVGFLFVGSMTVGAGEVSPKVAAHPPRAAADTRPPEPPAPPLGVAAADETEAERQWLDRVRRLPEIWPGGTYVMTDRRMKLEMKHERVEHGGREALRLTDRLTVTGEDGKQESGTIVYLCRPDKYLTPIRLTAGKEGQPPTSDLTFEKGRGFGTSNGEKVQKDLPERFVLSGLMHRWIALMPFAAGARERVTTLSWTGFRIRKIEVLCSGEAEMVVNRKRQRIWTIATREPDAADPQDSQEMYLFNDQRRLQKYVHGATPMGELVPEE